MYALFWSACGDTHRYSANKWAHLGSNQGPSPYEGAALTAELWALATPLCANARLTSIIRSRSHERQLGRAAVRASRSLFGWVIRPVLRGRGTMLPKHWEYGGIARLTLTPTLSPGRGSKPWRASNPWRGRMPWRERIPWYGSNSCASGRSYTKVPSVKRGFPGPQLVALDVGRPKIEGILLTHVQPGSFFLPFLGALRQAQDKLRSEESPVTGF